MLEGNCKYTRGCKQVSIMVMNGSVHHMTTNVASEIKYVVTT